MTEKRIVAGSNTGLRLDVFLSENLGELSRSGIKKLISEGLVTVNGDTVQASYIPKQGDEIHIILNEENHLPEPEDIPLDIVFEDDDLMVINKQKGITTHPAPGNMSGSLVNALLYLGKPLSDSNGDPLRPGIVHRIDKDTTGLILVAKTNEAHEALQKQIQDKTARRIYYALCYDRFRDKEGTVDAPIGRHPKDRKKMAVISGGRPAQTEYRVLRQYKEYTLVELSLKTGRTHQIRVHMAYIGHPVVGDEVYGRKKNRFSTEGQMLHAKIIEFDHPSTGEHMVIECPLPDYFERILDRISGSELE